MSTGIFLYYITLVQHLTMTTHHSFFFYTLFFFSSPKQGWTSTSTLNIVAQAVPRCCKVLFPHSDSAPQVLNLKPRKAEFWAANTSAELLRNQQNVAVCRMWLEVIDCQAGRQRKRSICAQQSSLRSARSTRTHSERWMGTDTDPRSSLPRKSGGFMATAWAQQRLHLSLMDDMDDGENLLRLTIRNQKKNREARFKNRTGFLFFKQQNGNWTS